MTSDIVVRQIDSDTGWVNATGLPTGQVEGSVQVIARQLARWVDGQRASRNKLSMFDRTAYASPDNPYARMVVARAAVDRDDIVGGAADVLEGLAIQGVQWESPDPDEADIFNQISAGLNLDAQVRTFFRELFTYSQAYIALWWGRKEYKVRGYNMVLPKPEAITDPVTGAVTYRPKIDPDTGKPERPKKNPRKRRFDIATPVAMTFLDPTRVVPLQPGMFGQDRLCWHASRTEIERFGRVQEEEIVDVPMRTFFLGRPSLTMEEREDLGNLGVDVNRLLMLNPELVKRHAVTKAPYERFASIRLASTFPLLDLKQQLMEADRVFLVGAANYIILAKKGTPEDPAEQAEVDNLREGMKTLAKLPVIVGDHRIEIEIITPDQQHVIQADRYDTLDRRILMRCLGSLSVTSTGQRNESTLTTARGIARLLETRRHMMKRTLEEVIARAVTQHPFNAGKFKEEPRLAFTPRHVQLDNDNSVVQAIMNLRTQKELSRESILEFFGFDQEVEATRREHEAESGLDDLFGTRVPFDSPLHGPPGVTGFQGGRPQGGGQPPQSPQGQTQNRAPSGNTSTGGNS